MSFNYTRSQFLLDVSAGIRGKIAMIASPEDFANRVVRDVFSDVALRSARRRNNLSPDLFPGIEQYACPLDLHDNRIIDIPAQAKRQDGSFGLIPIQQFNVGTIDGQIAIDDYNGVRTLLIDSAITSENISISPLENLNSGGGTWVGVGDAVNVRADSDDFIKGNGSVAMDIGAGATLTAGIENLTLAPKDVSSFLGGTSAVFVWIFISNVDEFTGFTVRLGSSNLNYYSKSVVSRHDGNAFQRGWNLVRFPLTSLSEVGTVNDAAITYAAIIMDKTSAKVNETNFKFNWLVVINGVIHNILYYTKYGWVNSIGVYIENSTSGGDLLVADTSEYNLIVMKGISRAMRLTNFTAEEIKGADKEYLDAIKTYGMQNPDESQLMVSTYHKYAAG
jgi:hypothetical protein